MANAANSTRSSKSSDKKTSRTQTYKINYLSKDFVYLKAGRAQGIDHGDTLTIERAKKLVAVLVVEFASDYSSSCKIQDEKGNIVLGDVATLKAKSSLASSEDSENQDSLVSRTRELPNVLVQGEVAQAFARTRGNIAYQMYLEKGFASEKLELSRQNIRMNIRMSEMRSSHYSVHLDMYATQRSNLFAGAADNSNWENRVNQFSFGYDNPGGKVSYEIGRVIPEGISSIGYIDGGAFKLQATKKQYIGGFAGNIPRMLYYQTPVSVQKYGGFYGLDFEAGTESRFENMVGYGEERNGTADVSREFFNLKNSMYLPYGLSLSQTSEIDYNTGWRYEKTKKTFALSSMYINGNWKATKKLSFSMQYDTRRNYYRLDMRTLADSLFDDAVRIGLKENVYYRFLPSASIYMGLGQTQLGSSGSTPYNYNLGFSVDNFILKRVYLNTYYSGFKSDLSDGYNGSLYLRKSYLNGNDLSLGYGLYQYNYTSTSGIQSNWLRLGGTVQLIFKTYMSMDYEYSWGDTDGGHRGFVEMGYWL